MIEGEDADVGQLLARIHACALQAGTNISQPQAFLPKETPPSLAMRFRVGEPLPKPKEKEPTEQEKPLADVEVPQGIRDSPATTSPVCLDAGPAAPTPPPPKGAPEEDGSLSVEEEPALKVTAVDEPAPARETSSGSSTAPDVPDLVTTTPAPEIVSEPPSEQPVSSNAPAPSLVPATTPREPDRESDSGSSLATEAYNSEDEHNARPSEGAPSASSSSGRAGPSSGVMLTPEQRESAFRSELLRRNWEIVVVRADGNCLFRALAHALWGDEALHTQLRVYVMDYMLKQRDHFSQFVAEDFPRYVRRKRRDGCHGNHVELQAAADLLGVRIEVYAYSLSPVTVVEGWNQREREDAEPIRLSFHRGSHYNAVMSSVRPRRRWSKKVPPTSMYTGGRAAGGDMEEVEFAALADALATQEEIEQATLQMSILDMVDRPRRGSAAGSSSTGAFYGPLMDADADVFSKMKRARAGPSSRPPPSPSTGSVGSDGETRGGAGPSWRGPSSGGDGDNLEGSTESG